MFNIRTAVLLFLLQSALAVRRSGKAEMSEERCFQLLCLVSWCRRVSRPVSRPPERFHQQDLQSPCLMESHLNGSSLAAGEGSIFEEPVVSENALETVLKSSRISAVDTKVRRPKMVLCSNNKTRSSLNSPASTRVLREDFELLWSQREQKVFFLLAFV